MSKAKFEDIEFTGGYTLLMLKAEEGNFDEVQRMITELKHLDVDAANKKGYTSLALAVKAGHSDVVRLLIASGANPDLKNNSGQSPLFLACWNNHEQIMEVLLDNGVEINTVDHRGWTPLMIAAYHGHRHIVRELLLRKADPSIQDLFGKKAVDRAKDPEIVRMLQGGNLNKVNYSSPRLKEKGNLPYSPGRTAAGLEQRTQENQPSSILKKSSSRVSVGVVKTENERSQPLFSPETVQETGPSGKKGAAQGKIAEKKGVEPRKGAGQQKATQPNKKGAPSTGSGTGKTTPAARSEVGGAISPSRSQNSRRVSNSPTSALDRQMFKEDLIYMINEQMDQVGPKMQQIIENKIALEIPMQMQVHENQFKKQVETVLRYKATDIFKNLQAIFNLKLKFCLTKLGYDTNELGMTNFLESESGFNPETISFDKEPLRAYNEKEFKAIENDINRLEKAVLSNKISQQAGARKSESPSRNKGDCDHTSQLHRTEIRNEVFDHVGHEVRSTTEYLLEYSHGRVNELAREESAMLYKKITAEVTDNMEALEDELKRKFEEIISFKMNKIIEVLGSAAQSGALNENPKTFEKGLSRNYSSTGNSAGGKYKAENTVSSVYSDRRATEMRKSGQLESTQAKDKIMKLKNSLNFMDESGEQRPDKLRQSGGLYQSQDRGADEEEEDVERAPEPEAAEEENDEDAEVERIYNPSYRSTLKGESVQSGQSGQREYWSPGLNRGNSGSKSKPSQQPQGRGTADSKSNQKGKHIPGHRVEQGGEQEMMKYYDFSNE